MYKEIWKGSGAKSYMKPGFLINEGMHEIELIYEEAICHTTFHPLLSK